MKKTGLALVLALLCVPAAVVAGCEGQELTTSSAEVTATSVVVTSEGGTSTTAASQTTETTPTSAPPATTATTAAPTTTTKAPPKPPVWTKLDPSGPTPPAREGAAMVCNPKTGRIVLFGGWDWSTHFNDLWVYNPEGDAWIPLTPSGDTPAGRRNHTLVYESVNGKILLFGGRAGIGEFNDLWAYDPPTDTWTKLTPGGVLPQARKGHSAFFDPKTGKMYVFGGSHGGTRYNDLWAYDVAANSWAKLTPSGSVPGARETASMAYNPNTGRAFLWGGYNGIDLDDAWAYDPPTNTWIAIPLSGSQPSGRSFSPLVYTSVGKRMVLFGGFEYGGEIRRDTWAFTPSTGAWTKLDPSGNLPSGRANHALAFATGVDKVILFGGTNDEAVFSDTWAYGSAP